MDHYAFVLEALQRNDYRRLRSYMPDGQTRFSTWLLVVARRLCVDHHRAAYGRASKEAPSELQGLRARLNAMQAEDISVESLPGTEGRPDKGVQASELARFLALAKESLSPEDRMLLSLRFEDEAPVREIADLLGFSSVFAVYRRLKKVLRQLRRELEERGVAGPEP